MRVPVYYGDYLRLDRLLSSQEPESAKIGINAHDEMLFIIVHQAYELWFKQILHELDRVETDFGTIPVTDDAIAHIVHGLNRIYEILKLVVAQLDVLETMTPFDFLDFRDLLMPASGFQSLQFRLIETRLGLPPEMRIPFDDKSIVGSRGRRFSTGEGGHSARPIALRWKTISLAMPSWCAPILRSRRKSAIAN
jgi:tryptophan 2,3-dioxygenase